MGIICLNTIVKNKLFFFANFESDDRTDLGSNFIASRPSVTGSNVSNVLASDLDNVSSLLSGIGYETGAYENYLQTKTGNTTILQNNFIVDGVAKIAYNGVELINLDFVDEGLELYVTTGSPASTVNHHRLILTVPSNHTLQMDGSGYTMIDPQYILADDEVLSPLTAMIDYQYGFGDLNVIAGF